MAAPTFFTHDEIVDVISDVKPFQNFLLHFFGMEYLSQDEQINFDKITDDKRIAVFVNPRRPGEVIKQRGSAVVSYKPGYIKDKRTVDPTHVFKRKAGQPMNSALTPSQRYSATIVDLSLIQVNALYRRLEWMAAQLLLDGTYDMVGDDINVNIDFDRKASKTVTKTTTARWLKANANVSPVDDVEELIEESEAPIRAIIMGKYAFRAFRRDSKFTEQMTIESRLGDRNFTDMPQKNGWEDVTFRCTIMGGTIPIYTFTGTYTDPVSGTETAFIPDDAVIGVCDNSNGYQCFSTIQDADANYETLPYFMKNWAEKDPGIPYLMLQSAPMLAHKKIDGTFSIRTAAIKE